MADVFLSYARSEKERVQTIVTAIQAQGWTVWWDQDLESGDSWDDTIEAELRQARVVVTLFSRASVDSRYVRAESLEALDAGTLLPVLFDDIRIPLNFRTVQYTDLVGWPDRGFERIEKLLRAIALKLEQEPPRDYVLTNLYRKRRWPVVTASVVGATVLAAGLWFALMSGREMRTEPLTLLISDFDNQTGEAILDDSVEDALQIGLEGAPFISVYPRRDARRLAEEQSGDSYLGPDSSRLVATREGVDMILTGVIAQVNGAYSVRITGMDTSGQTQEFDVYREGVTKVDLLPAVAELAADARASMGDVEIERDHLTETLTTSSLEAMATYFDAQRHALNWEHAEAVELYEKAIELDDRMARAYSGLALSEYYLGNTDASAKYFERAIALSSRLTRRERYRTLANYYVLQTNDIAKAIETYEALIAEFPNEPAGLNNLAVTYAVSGQFANAVEAGRKVLAIYPSSLLYQGNLGLYLLYDSQLDEAARVARGLVTSGAPYYAAYLPEAIAALDALDMPRAAATHDAMAAKSGAGRSYADTSRADALLYRGDRQAASEILDDAIPRDVAAGRRGSAATKHLLRGGADHVEAALAASSANPTLYFAVDHFLATGEFDRVATILDSLSTRVDGDSVMLHGLLAGRQALAQDDYPAAVRFLRNSLQQRDFWLARYWLGRTYLASGNPVQAMSEFEQCIDRRGEASAVFIDENPTFHLLPPLFYWHARASEAAGVSDVAVASYRKFLAIRGDSDDVLVADARLRADALDSANSH